MSLKLPESMEELVYWTARKIDKGSVKAWVHREECTECNKAMMGKPRDKGKVKIRATYYECPECKNTVEKKLYEETLTVNILYTCPKCQYKGEIQVPYKKKRIKGTDAIIFECEKCHQKIPITKKMKDVGEKA
ncbi:MAG: hypothetical protein ABIJ34_08300 [archaeon]